MNVCRSQVVRVRFASAKKRSAKGEELNTLVDNDVSQAIKQTKMLRIWPCTTTAWRIRQRTKTSKI